MLSKVYIWEIPLSDAENDVAVDVSVSSSQTGSTLLLRRTCGRCRGRGRVNEIEAEVSTPTTVVTKGPRFPEEELLPPVYREEFSKCVELVLGF